MLLTNGIDDPLSLENGGATYYYHKDGLGSITSLTNSEGIRVQAYGYDGFGNTTLLTGTLDQPYAYTGREWDEETGLYYYRARYYDTVLGRFISKDPIGFAAGDVNVYNYVGANPVNWVDPWGTNMFDPYILEYANDLYNYKAPVADFFSEYRNLKRANYLRNIYNETVSHEEAKKRNWDNSVSAFFHRQGRGNEENIKYVSPDGHCEAIFTKDGEPVTDPVNGPTYNYEDPRTNPVGHFFQDILPYLIWGSSPTDPTR